MNNHDHPLFSKVCNIMEHFNLTQVITDCTHTSPNGNSSLIDLALVSSPPQSVSCTTIPPLANSDHDGLRLTISHKGNTQRSNTNKRTIWRYTHADFSKANHLISQTDWNSLYCEDIDQHCTQWQDMYMSIMEQCIPTKVTIQTSWHSTGVLLPGPETILIHPGFLVNCHGQLPWPTIRILLIRIPGLTSHNAPA